MGVVSAIPIHAKQVLLSLQAKYMVQMDVAELECVVCAVNNLLCVPPTLPETNPHEKDQMTEELISYRRFALLGLMHMTCND